MNNNSSIVINDNVRTNLINIFDIIATSLTTNNVRNINQVFLSDDFIYKLCEIFKELNPNAPFSGLNSDDIKKIRANIIMNRPNALNNYLEAIMQYIVSRFPDRNFAINNNTNNLRNNNRPNINSIARRVDMGI